MHELSLITSVLDIVREEMTKHGLTRLIKVKLCHGQLVNAVPEALTFAFEALVAGTDFEGATLECELLPLHLTCACGVTSTPDRATLFSALCPACGAPLQGLSSGVGHEFYIDHLEAE